ncbi:MAG: hypothetical protein Q9186_003620 [Xanthomendoza sp. 1 TL-2023]
MARPARDLASAAALLQLIPLLTDQVHTVIAEWALESSPAPHSPEAAKSKELSTTTGYTVNGTSRTNAAKASSPSGTATVASKKLHAAQRTILSICGKLTELVSEPSERIIEVGCQYWESRALAVAVERRIPDILDGAVEKMMDASDIAERTGIEQGKLGETVTDQPDGAPHSPNTLAKRSLTTGREDFEINFDLYTASDHLPTYLLSPEGHSYKVEETPFQNAVGTKKPRWDWLEEKITRETARPIGCGYPGVPALQKLHLEGEDGHTAVARPELETFGLAMTGGGKVYGMAHLYDFPWEDLGTATIVDVGGGLGGFDIQLSHLYPDLKFVVQDRGPVIKQAETVVWVKEAPQALAETRVSFMEHDFFEANPVKGAEVYWLRYIMQVPLIFIRY